MGAKVLVVDDSVMIRQQVRRSLSAAEFTVIEAKDGVEALEQLDQNEDVVLVVCDVNMPRMGGLDFLEHARKDPRFKSLLVVMLTTEAQPELVQRGKELDAKGWLLKPFKADLLLGAVRKLVPQKVA